MSGTSSIEEFYALRRAGFGFLERLLVRQAVTPSEWRGLELELDLRLDNTVESPLLRLVFRRVRDLRLGRIEGLLVYVIDIRTIADAQLEDIKYKVTEAEHDLLSFVCDAFAARVEES